MNEDLKLTKTMLDFYMENFSLQRSTNVSTTTTQPITSSSSLEMEQIILNRLLQQKSTSSDLNPNDSSGWDEFANIYYDLQENERRLQYLDKVLIQTKFEELKKLYSLWLMNAMQLSSTTTNSESDSITSKSSSSSSLEPNDNNNQTIQNYQQLMTNVQDKLKQLQMDIKLLQQDSGLQFQSTILRLLKYYRKLFNMIPKEILLNLPLIQQLHNNNKDGSGGKNVENLSIDVHSDDDDNDDGDYNDNNNNDGNNSDEAFSDVDQESESSRSIDCVSNTTTTTTTTTTTADQRKLQHSYRQFLLRLRLLSANQQHLYSTNMDLELKKGMFVFFLVFLINS